MKLYSKNGEDWSFEQKERRKEEKWILVRHKFFKYIGKGGMVMFKKLTISLLALSMLLTGISLKPTTITATEKQTLNIAVVTTDENNDLYKTLVANYNGIQKVSTIDAALELNTDDDASNDVKGIMVLADTYPSTTTVVTTEQAEAIASSNVRLYIEYPANNDTLGISGYSGTNVMNYNRGIVTNAEKMNMDKHSLLYVHGARFISKSLTPSSIDSDKYWLVSSKVAGYDVAEYGITEATYSLIEVNENVMVASTKFSQFISGRYAPYERYQKFWMAILSWLSGIEVTSIEWNPVLQTAYGKSDTLDADAYAKAVEANTKWYENVGFIMSEKDAQDYMGGAAPDEIAKGIYTKTGSQLTLGGDGSYGIIEAFVSGNNFTETGEQYMRFWRRADCTGESAGNIALAGDILNNDKYTKIAYNVVNWLLTESFMSQGDRANPEKGDYGLLTWHDGMPNYETYYGDDNAKSVLGLISALAALRKDTSNYADLGFDSEAKYIEALDKLDKRMLEVIIGNYRTTSKTGMRGAALTGNNLDTSGWEAYFNGSVYHYAPHFEALNWATFLWAYGQTGYEPLLERTRTGITNMMVAYEKTMANNSDTAGEWKWTNGLQQERAKMILPMAWLVRIEPTEKHIEWLNMLITDMMMYQDATTGALQDRVGEAGQGVGLYGSHPNNDAYGKHEAPVIQNNGDPCIDALYTSSFAMMSLNESVAAMNLVGNTTLASTYKAYSDKLSNFFVRIQTESEDKKYDGVWFRGFDYEKWEVYGSDGDAGWGVWCTETGWSQAWISNTLSMKVLNTNIWDYSQNSSIEDSFEETAILMLNYEPNELLETVSVSPLGNGSIDVLTNSIYGNVERSDGQWIGTEGEDITITVDYQEEKTFDRITLGFNLNMNFGVCTPESVTYYLSEDGIDYKEIGNIAICDDAQKEYDTRGDAKIIRPTLVLDEEAKAQYLKVVVKNPGNYMRDANNDGVNETNTKTWIFMDELELGISKATISDLYEILKITRPLIPAVYSNGTGEILKTARDEAETVYADKNATDNEIASAYKKLKEAYDNLEMNKSVLSMTTSTDGDSKDKLIDGIYSKSYNFGDDAYVGWHNVNTVETVIDLKEPTGIGEIGFSALSRPQWGIYAPNATVYISSDNSTWKKVGSLDAPAHDLDKATPKGVINKLSLENKYGRYVKFVFESDDNHLIDNVKNEYIFIDEIIIERNNYILPTVTVVEGSLAYKERLVDGELGSTDFSIYRNYVAECEGADFTFVVDYVNERTFDTVKLGAFEHLPYGIVAPSKVEVLVSDDNVNFTPLVTMNSDGIHNQVSYERMSAIVHPTTTRYVKVKVTNAGQVKPNNKYVNSWVMLDEFETLNTGDGYANALQSALDTVADVNVNAYTEESASKFIEAKESIQKLLEEGTKDKELMDTAIETLNNAKTNLVVREVISMPDNTQTNINKLVDLLQAASADYTVAGSSDKYVNFRNESYTSADKTFVFVVDLKETVDISNVGFSNTSRPGFGIYTPIGNIYVSDDNSSWEKVATTSVPTHTAGNRNCQYFETIENVKATGRYVKYELTLARGQEWLFMDELIINDVDAIKASLALLINDADAQTATVYGSSVVSFKNALKDAKTLLTESDILVSEYQSTYDTLKDELNKLLAAPVITYSNSLENVGTNGDYNILDGVFGSLEGDPVYDRAYCNGTWSGNQNKANIDGNLTITINLKEAKKFNQLALGFLKDEPYNIYYPKSVKYFISTDGVTYEEYDFLDLSNVSGSYGPGRYVAESHIKEVEAQYVKIEIVKNNEWFFFDEFTFNTVSVNRDEISSLIDEVEALVDSSYTTDTMDVVKSELAEAKAVNSDSSSKQDEIDQAVKELKEAKDALISVKALKEAVAEAKAAVDNHTPASVEALNKVIEEAEKLYKDGSEEAINEAISNVNNAVENLVDKGNPEELKEAVEEAKQAKEDAYTTTSYSTLVEALEKANNVLEDENATQEMMDEALADIQSAKDALVDITGLTDIAEKIEKVNPEDYSEESYKALEEAIEDAQEVLTDPEATQEDMDEVVKGLEDAYNNLVEITEIKDVVEDAEKVDPEGYSEESIKALEEAIENAKEAMISGSNEEIEKAIQAIKDALANLEEMEEPTGSDTGDTTNVGGLLAMMIAALGVLLISRRKRA